MVLILKSNSFQILELLIFVADNAITEHPSVYVNYLNLEEFFHRHGCVSHYSFETCPEELNLDTQNVFQNTCLSRIFNMKSI